MIQSSRPGARGAAALAILLSLPACQGAGGLASSSPSGKPVVVESIEGAPAEVRSALTSELAEAATSRKVELVGLGQDARYRMRGYLKAAPGADGGGEVAFVWDVFDVQANRRSRRVAGTSPLPAGAKNPSAKNPWQDLDKEALRRLAARSLEEIAAFLAAPDAPAAALASAVEEPTG